MVLYTCQRCGYENKIKSHFIKHLNRKKPCDITLLSVDQRVSNKKSYTILEVAKMFNCKIKFLKKRPGERYASALSKMNLSNKVYRYFGNKKLVNYIQEFISNNS